MKITRCERCEGPIYLHQIISDDEINEVLNDEINYTLAHYLGKKIDVIVKTQIKNDIVSSLKRLIEGLEL